MTDTTTEYDEHTAMRDSHDRLTHPERPCVVWMCHRESDDPTGGFCPWHLAMFRARRTGASTHEAATLADAATRPPAVPSTAFAECVDCRSVVSVVHTPATAVMSVEVQHSEGCPAWPHDGREVALAMGPHIDHITETTRGTA